jgi:hypothetical protein
MFRRLFLAAALVFAVSASRAGEQLFRAPLDVKIPHISTDKSIKYDYDIVYVRAKRAGDKVHKRYFTDFSQPVTMEPGADLMLLHPDGKEELLVAGGDGSITDPVVSFDGKWVYYSHIYNLKNHNQWNPPREGADIFKIHVPTRKIVRLTNQRFSPNTGATKWALGYRQSKEKGTYFEYGVFNMGPCPLPGGRIAFTSNRDGFRPAKGYPAIALQLFVMDDRDSNIGEEENPTNLEKIGHLNISGALHPVVLMDGQIMYSTLESQGMRSDILWGVWLIRPDGTKWSSLVPAFDPGGAPNGFHFQTQLSNGDIVVEEYYNQNNSGFGAYIKLPPTTQGAFGGGFGGGGFSGEWRTFANRGYGVTNISASGSYGGGGGFGGFGGSPPAFGSADMRDDRNPSWRFGRFDNGKGKWYRMPFMPNPSKSLTPFALNGEGPADHAVLGDKKSPAVGKFTHPSGAPDNHLLTCYSPGPVNHQYTYLPQLDGGIYLLKEGKPVDEPAQLRLIKNDPEYNECWPRALVPYARIYGIARPSDLTQPALATGPAQATDNRLSKHLPEGTPFGLVGTSSLYKRESYPGGRVPKGGVKATYPGGNDPWKGLDPFTTHGNGMPLNWHNQGADAGLYSNNDIHAIRILVQEPTTDRQRGNYARDGRLFYNHAQERLRILGEIPVRKPGVPGVTLAPGTQPKDQDGYPDTSFHARIPADTAFTFQTLDKDGMVLNAAQTWHQLRPGEVRNDCGGCHAHSQPRTDHNFSADPRFEYPVWDLVNQTPLLTTKANDTSGKKWDTSDRTGLRIIKNGPLNVEYFRDVQPILKKSCVACHTASGGEKPTGNLNLDADAEKIASEHRGQFPGTYYRLALDENAKFGHKPVGWDSWGAMQASRYIRKMQSRRSLLAWKIFGKRLDGFSNDDHPSESEPGKGDLVFKGKQVDVQKFKHMQDIDFTGSIMPPPDAVKAGKVAALADEDRRTLVRWIDLGCPIDLDYDPAHPDRRGEGWMADDNRPILTLTYPRVDRTEEFSRILIGMHDYYTGLDMDSFTVVADFDIDGTPAGTNLASKFKGKTQGVWELKLVKSITDLEKGKLTVAIKDRAGNIARIERTISAGPIRGAPAPGSNR